MLEAAIVEELAQQLEDCYAELLVGGATEAEAERQTRAELSGNELLARANCDAWNDGSPQNLSFREPTGERL